MTTMITARGFPIKVGDHGLVYYRSLVSQVYNARYLSQTLTNSDRIDALLDLKELFGLDYPQTQSLKDWFKALLTSQSLTTGQLMLIQDTLKYINTGVRNTPLAVYETVLDDSKEDGVTKISEVMAFDLEQRRRHERMRHACLEDLDKCFTSGMFTAWVSSDAGMMDFVSFVDLIIGKKD